MSEISTTPKRPKERLELKGKKFKIACVFPYIHIAFNLSLPFILPPGPQTSASSEALSKVRDPKELVWYVVPLLALMFYIYAKEIRRARKTGNWDYVLAGIFQIGLSMVGEPYNGWVLCITGRSAMWTVARQSAYLIYVGLNLEIMFIFSFIGTMVAYTLPSDKEQNIWGIRTRTIAIYLWTLVAVLIEMLLNYAGLLVWEYHIWNRNLIGGIFVYICYLTGFMNVLNMLDMPTTSLKIKACIPSYLLAILFNILGFGVFHWNY